jgi:hypothetical protein
MNISTRPARLPESIQARCVVEQYPQRRGPALMIGLTNDAAHRLHASFHVLSWVWPGCVRI